MTSRILPLFTSLCKDCAKFVLSIMEQQKLEAKHVDDIDVLKHDYVVAPEARETYGPAGQSSL